MSQPTGTGHAAVHQPSNLQGQQPGGSGYFEPLLNDERAAELLGNMHVKTLQRMARYDRIPAHKIGRFWYFRASELNAWLNASCATADVELDSGHRSCLVN